MTDQGVSSVSENCSDNTADSSYMLKHVSFEDSQVDHFVPYSSPYILCWHNNKDRMEDVTLFTGSQSTRNISDSNVSEVEKGRNEDLSSSNLVQISADDTLNSTDNNACDDQPRLVVRQPNYSIDEYESDKSEIKELSNSNVSMSKLQVPKTETSANMSSLNAQLRMLDLNHTKEASLCLSNMPYPAEKSNDFLTNVTSKSNSDASTNSINETSYYSFDTQRNSHQKNRLHDLTNQTPSLNLLGTSLKNNLNQLFNDQSLADSTKKKASSTISETTCVSIADMSYRSDTSQKTNDMATSPIKFVALSPTASLTPSNNSSIRQEDQDLVDKKKDDHDYTSLDKTRGCSSMNDTNPCEDLWEKSRNAVPEIEFSYSDISEKSAGIVKENRLDQSTASTALTSVSNRSINSITSVTKNELEDNDDIANNSDSEDDIELDADMMKLLNKNIKRMIKKSFEKSRKMSINATNSTQASYNPLLMSANSVKSSCSSASSCSSSRQSMTNSVCSSQLVRKNPDSPIVRSRAQEFLEISSQHHSSLNKTPTADSNHLKDFASASRSEKASNYSLLNESRKAIRQQPQLQVESTNQHRLSEVSTQTSFIANKEVNKENSVTKPDPDLAAAQKVQAKKDKIKELLQSQKQQHEKRLRALERLANIEKEQATKLQNLMQASHGESILCNSYFQQNALGTTMDGLNVSELELSKGEKTLMFDQLLKENENSFPDMSRCVGESKVEVISLSNTSVLRKPEGVLVVKERKQSFQQTNEIHATKNGRLIFSNLSNKSSSTNSENKAPASELRRESHINFNSPLKPVMGHKPEAWFLPVTPKLLEHPKKTKMQPFKETQNLTASPLKPHNCTKTILKKPSSYGQLVNWDQTKGQHNISLQEAFETHKQDLIDRSIRRQNVIQSRAQQRYQEAEFKRQHTEIMLAKQQQEQAIRLNKEQLNQLKSHRNQMNRNNLTAYFERSEDATASLPRRRMSVQEIYSQNRRMYEKLPEVQAKQRNQRIEKAKELNRMRSSIYKKAIQQNVLTKGPNFNLKYKTMDDCF